MSINLVDLRHLRVGTKSEISAITNVRDGQFSLCTENKIMYVFVSNGASYTTDNVKVLSSAITGAKWVSVNIDVPYGFVYTFQISDWVDNGTDYELTVLGSGQLQTKALIQIYDNNSNIVGVSNIGTDSSDNYILTTCKVPDCRFKGKVVLLPTNGL